jgi:hypothetical protein
MPEMDSSTRSLIGWLKLNCTPGRRPSVARIDSMTCSLLRPVPHDFSGFMITNVSAWLGASSSVPSSGCPCSVKTSSTSGNPSSASRMSRSTSPPRSSETELGMVTVMWMSPSFIGGRNSEPRRGTSHVATPITSTATTAVAKGRPMVTRRPRR